MYNLKFLDKHASWWINMELVWWFHVLGKRFFYLFSETSCKSVRGYFPFPSPSVRAEYLLPAESEGDDRQASLWWGLTWQGFRAPLDIWIGWSFGVIVQIWIFLGRQSNSPWIFFFKFLKELVTIKRLKKKTHWIRRRGKREGMSKMGKKLKRTANYSDSIRCWGRAFKKTRGRGF